MSAIALIGCGALGRHILALLGSAGRPDQVACFDDNLHARQAPGAYPFEAHLDSRFADHDFYLGLGYHHLERKEALIAGLQVAGRRLPALVSPGSHVAADCRVGPGCVIFPGCNLDHEAVLESGVLLHNSVVVSHHSHVGTAAYLSPGVVLSGHVQVGPAAFLGTGTLVADHRRIGARARVGIGSVLTRDVPADTSVVGNPPRVVTHPLNLG